MQFIKGITFAPFSPKGSFQAKESYESTDNAECGCMSAEGSSRVPNDWRVRGEINLMEQADGTQLCLKPVKNEAGFRAFLYEAGHGNNIRPVRQLPTEAMTFTKNLPGKLSGIITIIICLLFYPFSFY